MGPPAPWSSAGDRPFQAAGNGAHGMDAQSSPEPRNTPCLCYGKRWLGIPRYLHCRETLGVAKHFIKRFYYTYRFLLRAARGSAALEFWRLLPIQLYFPSWGRHTALSEISTTDSLCVWTPNAFPNALYSFSLSSLSVKDFSPLLISQSLRLTAVISIKLFYKRHLTYRNNRQKKVFKRKCSNLSYHIPILWLKSIRMTVIALIMATGWRRPTESDIFSS